MRYRWDPAYPMGRRDPQATDAALRASDDERNGVADKLSRHYAEGRLDEVEFKTRLDTAMSATTRGDLNGLFHDLPPLPSEPPPPPPRHRRILPWVAPGGLPRHRGGCHHSLLPDVPRAVAALRRRRLRAVAPRRRPPPSSPSLPDRRRPAELGHGPLSGAYPYPSKCSTSRERPRPPRRPLLHGAVRRPARRRNRGVRVLLRPHHGPPRSGRTGPGRAGPLLARDLRRPCRGPT